MVGPGSKPPPEVFAAALPLAPLARIEARKPRNVDADSAQSPGCCQACPPSWAEKHSVAEPHQASRKAKPSGCGQGEARAVVEDAAAHQQVAARTRAMPRTEGHPVAMRIAPRHAIGPRAPGSRAPEAAYPPFWLARSCLARAGLPGGPCA